MKKYCEACRTTAADVKLEPRVIEGIPMLLCVEPTACRRRWQKTERVMK